MELLRKNNIKVYCFEDGSGKKQPMHPRTLKKEFATVFFKDGADEIIRKQAKDNDGTVVEMNGEELNNYSA